MLSGWKSTVRRFVAPIPFNGSVTFSVMTGRIRRDWTGWDWNSRGNKGAKSGLGIKIEIEDRVKKRMSEIAKEPGYSQVYGVLEY